MWPGHVMCVCGGGALDEKHNLQCPRLQQSANPGWPVHLGGAVMLFSSNGGERTPEATLGSSCLCGVCVSVCAHTRPATNYYLYQSDDFIFQSKELV